MSTKEFHKTRNIAKKHIHKNIGLKLQSELKRHHASVEEILKNETKKTSKAIARKINDKIQTNKRKLKLSESSNEFKRKLLDFVAKDFDCFQQVIDEMNKLHENECGLKWDSEFESKIETFIGDQLSEQISHNENDESGNVSGDSSSDESGDEDE
jgi:hypothetical protein